MHPSKYDAMLSPSRWDLVLVELETCFDPLRQ